MNIFVTDLCPEIAARNLLNKHCVKMPTESLGMLAFAFQEGEIDYPNSRKHRHFVHPASSFVRRSKENFNWLFEHFKVQLDEYKLRYKREHFAAGFKDFIASNENSISFPESGLTPFARCFSQYKQELDANVPDTVEAYREFYWLDKRDFAKWTSLDKIPVWWKDRSEKFVDKNFKNGEYIKR